MAKIEGEITIGRPVEVVFDFVADQTNEPQYNSTMVRAEKDSAGPIGKGSRFRSAVRLARGTAEMLIEITAYDRPRLMASRTTMKQMDIEYTLEFEPLAEGTRMRWSGDVHPKGALRLLGPVVTWMGRRQELRIWSSLKSHLENTPVAQG
jgi:polyketide cyclase/dehydrase/lipid transport protein